MIDNSRLILWDHAHTEVPQTWVDWEVTIQESTKWDSTDNYDGDEQPIQGAATARILIEYGRTAYRAANKPKDQNLLVWVWPPKVLFLPSMDGLDGVIIAPIDEQDAVNGVLFTKSEASIWGFTNIDGLRDGWAFFADMCMHGTQNETVEQEVSR